MTRLSLIVLAALLGLSVAIPNESNLRVSNDHGGSWTGILRNDVIGFYGIKYADAVRFGPPIPVKHSDNSTNHEFGLICAQSFGKGFEDCLFINVFIPRRNTTNLLPVAMHLHGGSYARGTGDDSQWPHFRFAQHGVVSVTFAYRVGLHGFLTLPQIAAEYPESPANYGLLDQRVALEWVRDNIAKFGGDPQEVTVFGESAGASSILYQMAYRNGTAPGGALFKRGWIIGPPSVASPEYEITRNWVGFKEAARGLGCDPESANVTACLRAIPSPDLDHKKTRLQVFPFVNAMPAEYLNTGWPCNDHVNFPDLGVAFANGQFDKSVTIVFGSDLDEGLMFAPAISPLMYPSEWLLERQVKMVYGEEKGAKIWEVYKPGANPRRPTSSAAFGDFVGDTILNCPTWVLARLTALNSDVPQYRYANEWVYRHAFLPSFGAFHTSSLVMMYHDLNVTNPVFATELDEDEFAASLLMWRKVMQFVRGELESFERQLPVWPKFEVSKEGHETSPTTFHKGVPVLGPYTAAKGYNGRETALRVYKHKATQNITIGVVDHWKNDDCSIWEELYPPHGMFAPPCTQDIWAEEELLPRTLNGGVWFIFAHPWEVAYSVGTLLVVGLLALTYKIIKCCARCCCKKGEKLKKD